MTDNRTSPTPPADTTDPGADLWLALVNSARPGTIASEAYLMGLRFRSDLAVSEGMTEAAYKVWSGRLTGRSLLVHLDLAGHPDATHLPFNEDRDQYLADNDGYVLVATWSVPTIEPDYEHGGRP